MQMETGGILLQERPIHISFDVADVMGKEADSTGWRFVLYFDKEKQEK